jgi:hypothetical protein
MYVPVCVQGAKSCFTAIGSYPFAALKYTFYSCIALTRSPKDKRTKKELDLERIETFKLNTARAGLAVTPALLDFVRSSWFGTGSTQPREYN